MSDERKNSDESDITTRTKNWKDDDGKNHTSMVSRQSGDEPEFPNCEWHPIESAPGDGIEIDLWVPEEGRITNARKSDGKWEAPPQRDDVWEYDERRDGSPTHWMPIPKPPK